MLEQSVPYSGLHRSREVAFSCVTILEHFLVTGLPGQLPLTAFIRTNPALLQKASPFLIEFLSSRRPTLRVQVGLAMHLINISHAS